MSKLLTATPIWDESRNYWKINVQRDRIRRSFYSSTPGRKGKAECMQKAQKWINLGADSDPIMCDAFDAWMKHKEQTVSSSTYRTLNSKMNRIRGCVYYNMRLSRISDNAWQTVIDKMASDGLSQASIASMVSAIEEFMKYCVASRWTDHVPVLYAKAGKAKKEKVILQPKNISVLFSDCRTTHSGKVVEDFYIHFYRFACLTGMRRGQVIGLKWSDIESNRIVINRAINAQNEETDGKTENSRRVIPLAQSIKQVLADQRAMLNKYGIVSPWVFPNESGRLLDGYEVYNRWKVYLQFHKMDSRITMHSLRRTMISMHKTDMPVELLKQVVGHSASMDTFGVYGRQMDGEVEQTAAIIDSTFNSVINR